MATVRKTEAHLAALAKVDDLGEQERAARARRDDARAHLADLQGRNHSGDLNVSGLDLITARADVEAAEGLAAHASRMVAEAQAEAAALLAEKTAQEVRDALGNFDMDKTLHDAEEALARAVQAVRQAIADRDALSDAAGQKLAEAGVAPGQWVNGIRYEPVRKNSSSTRVRGTSDVTYMGAVVPGRYNVAVQTLEGDTAWLAGEGLTRNSNQVIESILGQAWTSVRS